MSKLGGSKTRGAPVVAETPPPPPVAPPEDPIKLELMKRFLIKRDEARADMREFNNAKQKDWLRFFGFSMERELMWAKDRPDLFKKKDANSRELESADGHPFSSVTPEPYGVKSRPKSPTFEFRSTTAKASTNRGARVGHTDDDEDVFGPAKTEDPIQGNRLVEGADGGKYLESMSSKLEEADKRALEAPSFEGKTVAYIAEALTEPYKNVTWRLDEAQSTLLKARVIYRWICKHMSVTLPQAGTTGGNEKGPGHGKTLTFELPSASTTAHVSTPAATTPAKSALSKKGNTAPAGENAGDRALPSSSSVPHHNGGSAANTTTASDPVLTSRVGNPRTLATLFTDFLSCVLVDALVVKGALKGSLDARGKPYGYLKWGWNILNIPASPSTGGVALQLLVDLPLSMASVTSRAGIQPISDPSKAPAAVLGSAISPLHSKQSPRPLSPQQAKAASRGQTKEEDSRAQNEAAALSAWHSIHQERTQNYSAAIPRFHLQHDLVSHFEPFYFGCDPRAFASLHYPDEPERHMLLQRAVSRPQWESYPRLTHMFYKYQLSLDSHKRRSTIQCRAAPLYISFLLGDCAHVELTAAIYKGPIAQMNASDLNNPSNPNALGRGYVYSQRSESEGRITFTLMAPDVGVYTIVFGARRVNEDPREVGVSNSLFDIVATYQAQINFVALNEPILPHQHLTAATLKLVEPRDHKIIVGKQKFVVVPTTARVLSVAVINKAFRHSSQTSNVVAVGPNSSIPVLPLPAFSPPSPPSAGGKHSPKKPPSSAKDKRTPSASALQGDTVQITATTAPSAALPTNIHITLLDLNTSTCTFEGEVDAQQGDAEIWALIGDPNSLSNTMVHNASKITGGLPASKVGVASPTSPANRSGSILPPIARPQSSVSDVRPSSPSAQTPQQQLQQSALEDMAAAVLRSYPNSTIISSLSPEVLAMVPIDEPISVRNGSSGRINAVFVRAISDIQVVKRIMPKEQMLNEGKGVIQPVMAEGSRLLDDLPFAFRLISGSTIEGRRRTSEMDDFIGKPLNPVGRYFADKH